MTVTSPVSLSAYWRLVRDNRNYRLLWFAQVVSEIGDWLYAVAIYSLLLEATGSAQSVAFAFVLQVLPQVFCAPTAGVINDRLSRRRVMISADWARAVVVGAMLIAQWLQWIWLLYVLLFLETIFWALFEPARTAVVPNITSNEQEKLVANTMASTTWAFNLAVGAAVGGAIAAVFGRETVFVLNALSFVASALLISRMHFAEPHMEHLPPMQFRDLADFTPILEGVRYVRQDQRRVVTMFVKAAFSLLGTNWVILPLLGEREFRLTPFGLDPKSGGMMGMSLLMGCRGVGALLGPYIAGRFTGVNESNYRLGIAWAFVLAASGYLLLSQSQTLLLACVGVVIAHAGGSISWVFSTTLLQGITEDRFRGRVFSAEFAFSMFVLSVVSYFGALLVDAGMTVRTLALVTGAGLTLPGVLWLLAQRVWRQPKAL